MLQIPLYLIILTLILVIIPSITALSLRVSLYSFLVKKEETVRRLIKKQSPGKKPAIVKELEERFADASRKLEQVNTTALVEQVYSQQKVWTFSCDQIDYFCRILPNLLLSFGLLGTFLGITINLAELSQTINQTSTSDISNLVRELEKPLQGMSIAFTTSLTGLFFSAFLTIINSFKNTSIAKYRLISSLEDYLDNIYHPQVEGITRLDVIIHKMVKQQEEFLTRFGETVRRVVEDSLGEVSKEIAQGNKEAADLAKQVYERFQEGAGTISAAANNLEHSVREFQTAVNGVKTTASKFEQVSQTFENCDFPERLLAATISLNNIQSNFSQSTASLAETVTAIKNAVNELHLSSNQLLKMGLEIGNINKTSIEVLEAHKTNQKSFLEIIPFLDEGAKNFNLAIHKINDLEKIIANKSNNLDGVEVALKELMLTVMNYTKEIHLSIEALGERFVSSMFDKAEASERYIQTAITNFERNTNQLSIIIDTLKLDLMELLRNNNVKLIGEYKNVGNSLMTGMKQETELSIKISQALISNLQQCIKKMAEIKQEISHIREGQTNTAFKNNANSEELADFSSLFK
ncbi:hypothetical protein [Scytonema sp. UIC 10036]|uniref:hypothetical protein n=1 Tax=Scytonema sp. UIC 10036 TaxID=2304196 RepID=UPI001A9A7EB8|nr:hypothetical protein [Scytonema sp. UIC 10036]